jgi:FMN phosphatase YigB (HAD superfamily)
VRVLPIPHGLPVQRRHVSGALRDVAAITFDFGNTLVPVGRAALGRVVELTADTVVRADGRIDRGAFLAAWAEERDRQFAENVPRFREVDIAERLVRVFARLRGMPPPPLDREWDQAVAAKHSDPAEIEIILAAYTAAFVDAMPPVPGVGDLLARLAASGRPLAILSNWPLAATVDQYADAHGWSASLTAIVVSERVGLIKPHAAMFSAGRSALGDPEPGSILHVGDDWAADVAGAAAVGWRTAWVSERPADTPLPTSVPDTTTSADLTIPTVMDLEPHLAGETDPSNGPTRPDAQVLPRPSRLARR